MLSMASSPGRGYKNLIFNEKISSAKSEPDLTKNTVEMIRFAYWHVIFALPTFFFLEGGG